MEPTVGQKQMREDFEEGTDKLFNRIKKVKKEVIDLHRIINKRDSTIV